MDGRLEKGRGKIARIGIIKQTKKDMERKGR